MIKKQYYNEPIIIAKESMRVAISNYTEEDNSYVKNASLINKMSLINLDDCLLNLKNTGVIGGNETIMYLKIDWNSKLNNDNNNVSSVSYSLFTSTGLNIDINNCSSQKTSVEVYVGDNNILNKTVVSDLIEGVNVFDKNSSFFNDRCLPLYENDTEYTINERRIKYSGYDIICSEGCLFLGINSTTLYTKCSCDTSSSEVTADFSRTLLNAITTSNIYIVFCILNFNTSLDKIFTNTGLIIYTTIGVGILFLIILFNCSNRDFFTNYKKFKELLSNDTQNFHNKLNPEEYFKNDHMNEDPDGENETILRKDKININIDENENEINNEKNVNNDKNLKNQNNEKNINNEKNVKNEKRANKKVKNKSMNENTNIHHRISSETNIFSEKTPINVGSGGSDKKIVLE